MNGAKRLLSVGYARHVRRGRGWMPRIDAARVRQRERERERLEIDGLDGQRSLIDCLSFDREGDCSTSIFLGKNVQATVADRASIVFDHVSFTCILSNLKQLTDTDTERIWITLKQAVGVFLRENAVLYRMSFVRRYREI